jgi:transcriptional regulator with XRE-family HTH domain
MNELVKTLTEEWKDKETRQVYCDEFLNASIATQIKVLRERRGLTQAQLAALADMKQPRIAAMEDVNYASWTINVLRRLAEAFDLTLTVKFESFGEKLKEIVIFSRENLEKPSFKEDTVFQNASIAAQQSKLSGVRDFELGLLLGREESKADDYFGKRSGLIESNTTKAIRGKDESELQRKA